MALVTLFKFNDHCGALASDEEYRVWRRRKLCVFDPIQPLLDEDVAEATGLELVYGGSGNPHIVEEIVRTARKDFRRLHGQGKLAPDATVRQAALVVAEAIRRTTERAIDRKLSLYYGFSRSDLFQGSAQIDGKRVEIKQDAVKKNALKISTQVEAARKGPASTHPEHAGLLLGYDQRHGLEAFSFLRHEGTLYPVSGPFETRGAGMDVAQLCLSNYISRKPLTKRRQGYPPAEALLELLSSVVMASRHCHEVGGSVHAFVLNGKGRNRKARLGEFADLPARIGWEIAIGHQMDQLEGPAAIDLVNDLFFEGKAPEKVEEKLFAVAKDARTLDLLVRGYKLDSIPSPTGKARGGARKASRTRKGGKAR